MPRLQKTYAPLNNVIRGGLRVLVARRQKQDARIAGIRNDLQARFACEFVSTEEGQSRLDAPMAYRRRASKTGPLNVWTWLETETPVFELGDSVSLWSGRRAIREKPITP